MTVGASARKKALLEDLQGLFISRTVKPNSNENA